MKKILYPLLFLLLVVFLIFFTKIGNLLYVFYQTNFMDIPSREWKKMNIIVMLLYTTVGMVLAGFLAKKQKRSIYKWIFLAIFINLWAPIILLFKKGRKDVLVDKDVKK